MDNYVSTRSKIKLEAADEFSLPEFHGLSLGTDEPCYRRPDAAASRHWQPEGKTSNRRHSCDESSEVNKDGGALHFAPASPKTLKFNGRGSWEAHLAQFELLAMAARWSGATKALQLELSLTEDAALEPGGER